MRWQTQKEHSDEDPKLIRVCRKQLDGIKKTTPETTFLVKEQWVRRTSLNMGY